MFAVTERVRDLQMSGVDIVSVVFHTTTDSFGMLFNLVLLYLVIYRTPSNFEVYAILIGNFAITDFSACLASFLIQQRWESTNEIQCSSMVPEVLFQNYPRWNEPGVFLTRAL